MSDVLTYSALNAFRNCPRKYKHRYIDRLRPVERCDAMAFGSVIHEALEKWYLLTLPSDTHRLLAVLDFLDGQFNQADPQQKSKRHLSKAMMVGYASRYPSEDFEVLEVEKEFDAEIHNPDTGRSSQTFTMAGKVDGIVKSLANGELYVLEHKTASTITSDYLDRLWTDTQVALYVFYLRQIGYPIVGCTSFYKMAQKGRLVKRQFWL